MITMIMIQHFYIDFMEHKVEIIPSQGNNDALFPHELLQLFYLILKKRIKYKIYYSLWIN